MYCAIDQCIYGKSVFKKKRTVRQPVGNFKELKIYIVENSFEYVNIVTKVLTV